MAQKVSSPELTSRHQSNIRRRMHWIDLERIYFFTMTLKPNLQVVWFKWYGEFWSEMTDDKKRKKEQDAVASAEIVRGSGTRVPTEVENQLCWAIVDTGTSRRSLMSRRLAPKYATFCYLIITFFRIKEESDGFSIKRADVKISTKYHRLSSLLLICCILGYWKDWKLRLTLVAKWI